jgi:hypothetical protein
MFVPVRASRLTTLLAPAGCLFAAIAALKHSTPVFDVSYRGFGGEHMCAFAAALAADTAVRELVIDVASSRAWGVHLICSLEAKNRTLCAVRHLDERSCGAERFAKLVALLRRNQGTGLLRLRRSCLDSESATQSCVMVARRARAGPNSLWCERRDGNVAKSRLVPP